jgi:hypothetical protein
MLSRASFSRSSFSLPFGWSSSRRSSVDLPPVDLHSIETAAEKRPRTLKHLLKANHANYSIIYHNLQFHNHCSHVGQTIAGRQVEDVGAADVCPFWVGSLDSRVGVPARGDTGSIDSYL